MIGKPGLVKLRARTRHSAHGNILALAKTSLGARHSCIYGDLVLRFTRPQKKVLSEAGNAAAAPAPAAHPGQIPRPPDPAAGAPTEPGQPGPGGRAQARASAGSVAGAEAGEPGPSGRARSDARAGADAVAGEPGPGGKGQSGAVAEAVPGREPGELGLYRSPQTDNWTQVAADAAPGGVGRGGGAQSYAAGARAADAAQAGSVPGAEQAAGAGAVPVAEPGEPCLRCGAEPSAALAPGAEEDEWEVVPDSADESPL